MMYLLYRETNDLGIDTTKCKWINGMYSWQPRYHNGAEYIPKSLKLAVHGATIATAYRICRGVRFMHDDKVTPPASPLIVTDDNH